jgi:hypothetical protein
MFISITLLVLSTIVLALNTGTVGTTSSPPALVAPVQIRDSGREKFFSDFARLCTRVSHESLPAPVVMAPPAPVSGFHAWLTSSNKMATHLSSLMPMVMIYTTLWAFVSDALNSNWSHLLPALVVVGCAAGRLMSRSGLSMVLVLLRTECAWVVRIPLEIVWGLCEDLLSLLVYYVELGLTVSHVFLSFYYIC